MKKEFPVKTTAISTFVTIVFLVGAFSMLSRGKVILTDDVNVATDNLPEQVKAKADPCKGNYVISSNGKNCLEYKLTEYNINNPVTCCFEQPFFLNNRNEMYYLTFTSDRNALLVNKFNFTNKRSSTQLSIPSDLVGTSVNRFYLQKSTNNFYFIDNELNLRMLKGAESNVVMSLRKYAPFFRTDDVNNVVNTKITEDKNGNIYAILINFKLTEGIGGNRNMPLSSQAVINFVNLTTKESFSLEKNDEGKIYSLSGFEFDSKNRMTYLEGIYDNPQVPALESASINYVSSTDDSLVTDLTPEVSSFQNLYLSYNQDYSKYFVTIDDFENSALRKIEFDINGHEVGSKYFKSHRTAYRLEDLSSYFGVANGPKYIELKNIIITQSRTNDELKGSKDETSIVSISQDDSYFKSISSIDYMIKKDSSSKAFGDETSFEYFLGSKGEVYIAWLEENDKNYFDDTNQVTSTYKFLKLEFTGKSKKV